MARWKRAIYSLVSVLSAALFVGIVTSIFSVLAGPSNRFDLGEALVSSGIILEFSLPGWVAALPIVLLAKDYRGRLWILGATGVLIGPAVILLLVVWAALQAGEGLELSGKAISGTAGFFMFATAVSSITTAMYLFLVTRKPEIQTRIVRRFCQLIYCSCDYDCPRTHLQRY